MGILGLILLSKFNIMKKSITLIALCLMLGIGASKAHAKNKDHDAKIHEHVSIIPLHAKPGFAIMVNKSEPDKTMVIIYDNDKNVVYKDCLTKGTKAEKKYVLPSLAAGNYSVEVFSKHHDVTRKFYVYNKGDGKIIRLG